MRRSSGGGGSTALRRLSRHADYFGSLPPSPGDDDRWDDIPPEHRAALAEYVLHSLGVYICRAEEASGDRYWDAADCPGVDRVVDEAFDRGRIAIVAEGGAGIARLAAEFWAEIEADWPARLPHPPPDDDD
jgi:hypothetical protein